MINLNSEIKIEIKDPEEIICKLREKSAILAGGAKEITTRYDFEENELEKKGKYIRTRTGFNNIISVKEKITDNNEEILTRNDIEVEISNIKNMKYILKSIGLIPKFQMEKYRLKWMFNGNTINLDELFFGCFIEIHGRKEEIWKIINELELDEKNIIVGTYWDIFEEYKIENSIDVNLKDILFPQDYSYKIAQ